METTQTARYRAYRLRRRRVEMKRLFMACFGEQPVVVDHQKALERIRQRRRRGPSDAERVLAVGVALGYVELQGSGALLITSCRRVSESK